MEKCFLTQKGNVIRLHPVSEQLYLQSPVGEFICIVPEELAEEKVQESLEIDVHFPHPHSPEASLPVV